jgi:hypothetical protein
MAGIITATTDKETKTQIRYKLDKNKYGFSGVVYFPKEKFKGTGREAPEKLKLKIAFDRS